MRQIFAIYGAGGFGRELMALLFQEKDNLISQLKLNESSIYFIDDFLNKKRVDSISVLTLQEFLELRAVKHNYLIAIANPAIRESIFSRISVPSARAVSFVSKHAIIFPSVKLGAGTIIMPHAIISHNVKIGKFCLINFQSYVAHDCSIEDFVTISPQVNCSGNVIIKHGAFLGSHSSILQGDKKNVRYIGKQSILGIGSNLISDLPDHKVFVGNPAKEIN